MAKTPVHVIEFDFENRTERQISVDQVPQALNTGKCCWIDIDVTDYKETEAVLAQLEINDMAITEALSNRKIFRHDVHEDCLHVTVALPEYGDGQIHFSHVDLLLGERFLLTLHRGEVEALHKARMNYRKFFKHARSLGFLLFEFWGHLIDSFRRVFALLEVEVESVQSSIFGAVDDKIFNRVSGVSHNLIVIRRNALADREVLHQMAIHKSAFVSETTQPFLVNMVGTLERLAGDLTVEREILEETLNLYLGMVSHRTNRVVNRLTVISLIFLPLTFLCGIYGMNFEYLPEFHWEYGYVYFWALAACIVIGLLIVIKIKRWL